MVVVSRSVPPKMSGLVVSWHTIVSKYSHVIVVRIPAYIRVDPISFLINSINTELSFYKLIVVHIWYQS